jgi:hypothetical protein
MFKLDEIEIQCHRCNFLPYLNQTSNIKDVTIFIKTRNSSLQTNILELYNI